MQKILTLDAWMIFLAGVGSYLGLAMAGLMTPEFFIVYIAAIVAWVYYLGISLFKKLPAGHSMNLNKFRFCLFFPAIYFSIVLIATGGYEINNHNVGEYGAAAFLIIPLHLFSMFGLLYTNYFLSKSLACVMTQNKNVGFLDYIGNFIWFWSYPFLGVWFIQPKLKKVFGV